MTDDLDQIKHRALDFVAEDRCAEACPLFERLLEQRSHDVVAWMRYADCLAHLGCFEDELAATEWCRSHRAVWWLALSVRARCHIGLDDLESAVVAYEAVFAMKACVNTLVQLAGVLGDLGRVEEAISRLKETVGLEPDNLEAHKNLGYYLCTMGDYGESKSHIARALRVEPDYPEALAAMARTLIRKGGQPEAARALLRQALAARPRMDDARLLFAYAEWDLGNETEAIAIVEALVTDSPDEP